MPPNTQYREKDLTSYSMPINTPFRLHNFFNQTCVSETKSKRDGFDQRERD